MMYRHSMIYGLLFTVLLHAGCSEKPAPAPDMPPAATATQPAATDSANVTRAKLNAGGVAAQYSAHFDAEKLVRIEEQRQQGGNTFDGEYTFQGARLLRYRGAKLSQPATLDLEFDLQGSLQSGRGPDVTDEEIAAIRNRAQLLRSHALAERASRAHSRGY
jgi:hypothetical protein